MSVLEGNASDYYDNNYMYEPCLIADPQMYPEKKMQTAIITFLFPVLIILGTLGNVASIFLLRHLSVQAWSSCLYLVVLSLLELTILYIQCGGKWLQVVACSNPFFKVAQSSDALCKTSFFLLNVFMHMWPWMVVALSVELTIAIKFPLKTYRLCTRERARATILLITILLVCLNLKFFWTWGVVHETCIYVEEFSTELLNYIWSSIDTSVMHLLPLLVVVTCFLICTLSLLRSGRNGQSSYEPILKKYFLDLQALQQLKQSSLVLVFFFVMVKSFSLATALLQALIYKGVIAVPQEQERQLASTIDLLSVVNEACVYCFHSLKFFVYFAFCARFRSQFFDTMRKILFCRKGKAPRTDSDAEKIDAPRNQLKKDEDNSSADSCMSPSSFQLGKFSSHHPTVLNRTTHV